MKDQHLDPDEFLNVERIPFSEMVHRVMDGEIEDAKTIAAVLKAKVLLNLWRGDSAMNTQKTVLIVEDEKISWISCGSISSGRAIRRWRPMTGRTAWPRPCPPTGPDPAGRDAAQENGFDVCRALRDKGDNVPVIILTAREEEADKVLGLEIGADDYITKPFSMRELIARVGANIRGPP